MNFKCFFILANLTFYQTTFGQTKLEKNLVIHGLDFINQFDWSEDYIDQLNDDAFLGRLACPPLFRWNTKFQKFDTVILKSLPKIIRKTNGQSWEFKLKSGVKWWNGNEVSIADLRQFIESKIVAQFPKKILEGMTIEVIGRDTLMIQFTSPSEKGPYVFSGVPFFRSSGALGKKSECAGIYKIDSISKSEINLALASSSNKAKYSKISFLHSSSKIDSSVVKPLISFHKNSSLGCNFKINVPVQTGMIWKFRPREIESKALRQLIVDIFPKSEIATNLAPGLSEVQTFPISFMDFHLSKSFQDNRKQSYSELISRLEGIQKIHSNDGKLVRNNDSKIHLKIASDPSAKMQIIEKIIFDSFALLGIELDFVDISENFVRKGADFDGLLMTIYDKSPRPFLSEALGSLKSFEELQADSDFRAKMTSYSVDVEAFDRQISRGIINQDLLKKILVDFKKEHFLDSNT